MFAAAALAGVFYARQESDQNARTQALEEAGFAARSAARVVGEGVSILQSTLSGVATDPAIPRLLAHPASCVLNWGPAGAFPLGHFDIARPDGAIACTSLGALARRGRPYAGQPWFVSAGSAPQLRAPVRDPITGQPAAVFTAPLHGDITTALVDLDPVGPNLLMQLAGPKDLRYIVTTPDGKVVLARSTQPTQFVGTSIAQTAFFRNAHATERPDLGGTTRLFAHAVVPGIGWRVYAGLDQSVALAASGRLFDRELILIVVALLVVLAAAAIVQRRIARPIARLSGAVSRGGQDARAVVTGAPAEVVELAERFDTLVSSLRATEQDATAAAETYRELFDNHPQPMLIYDPATLGISEVNEAAIAHYGYTREEFLAMTIKDLVPEEDVPIVLDLLAGRIPPAERAGPWRGVKRDGTVIEVEVASHEVEFRGQAGQLVVITDVSERQRLSRQLEQVQRLESLGQLAGGVAHDFNNLLGVILNYAAFVLEELHRAEGTGWDTARADVEQIEQAARRATDLTHRLLAFARREVIHPEVISLNDAVENTRRLLRPTLGEHIELSTALGDELWPVMADPGQMEQILINLAVNARDAMPGGGRLMIETANVDVDESYATARPGIDPGRYVRLRVTDTGEGMDSATMERAFEPFFTTKPKGEGTGLGLATIYGIVTQADGYVRLYSERGLGTSVTVMLPATTEELATAPADDERDLSGHAEVVLVVEDEDAIREVARRVLERGGYQVLSAPGGPQALELVRERDGPIDLLLTDVIMPRMMGHELAAEVAALRPSTRVMYMSGYAQPLIGPDQGVPSDVVLIEKPFTEQTLLVKVQEALAPRVPDASG
ncbi:MAG: response regulator [Solirubrobacterales bacterium]|nr:response regulator [Solirubrobacterales bacterium]